MVTARKREENLQDTPLSIQALGRRELEQRLISSMTDLQSSIPNLSMPGTGASGSNAIASVFIRGIGQSDANVTMDSGVGIYIDGVYRARLQSSTFELMDVERIEVLRGPQGTLYGRNTVGGAINVIPERPQREAGLRLKLGVGNYNLRQASIIGDLPLMADRLYSRLSLGYVDRDGTMHNDALGDRWNDRQFVGGRIDLDFLATERVNFNLNADWSQRNLKNAASQCVVLNRSSGLFRLADDRWGYSAKCEQTRQNGRYHFAHDLHSLDDNEEWGGALIGTWDIASDISLKSITAYRRLQWETNFDVDATGVEFLTSRQGDSHQKQWSQEFQLQGASLDGDLTWTTGLFYFKEKADRPAYSEIYVLNRFGWRHRQTDNKSYALYGQASYQISPQWSLTTGIRYTYEQRYFSELEKNRLTWQTLADIKGKQDFDAVTPMINLAWTPKEGLMAYASWGRGFKAGGFNGRANPDSPFTAAPFSQEKVDAWELGVKSSWLDKRLIANLSVFYMDYDDIQLSINTATSSGSYLSLIQNAGKAVVKGAELEFKAQLTDVWSVSGGYGYTAAHYRKFDTINTATGGVVDQSHLDFASVPRDTYTLSSQWSLPWFALPNLDDVVLRIDYSHNSGYYNNVRNTPELKTHSYELLNASLDISFNADRTRLQLWGKNLGKEYYVVGAIDLADSTGAGMLYLSEPRTFGVTVSHRF